MVYMYSCRLVVSSDFPLSAGTITIVLSFVKLFKAFVSSLFKFLLGALLLQMMLQTLFLRDSAFASCKAKPKMALSVAVINSVIGTYLSTTAKLLPLASTDTSCFDNTRSDKFLTHLSITFVRV